MPNNIQKIELPECFPCHAKMMVTFAGMLQESQEVYLAKPMQYLKKTIKDMDAKHIAENKPTHIVHIERDPKDQRVFRFCSIQYGRRIVTYTNTAKLETRLAERKLTCFKVSTQTAIQQFTTDTTIEQYTATKQNEWHKAGYKGTFTITNGKSLYGKFINDQTGKELTVTGNISKGKLHIKRVLTRETEETIHADVRPDTWRQKIHREMLKDGFTGSLDTHPNPYGQIIVNGKYTKDVKIDNGTMKCSVEFYNNVNTYKVKGHIDENFRPFIKSGKSSIQVRSIAQDDIYTPQQRIKQRGENNAVQREYEKYLREMRLLDRIQLTQLEIEHIKSQNRKAKVSKETDKAKRWLQKILKEKPLWYKASNAQYLENYCVENIKKGVMTPHEADQFCDKNAKYI